MDTTVRTAAKAITWQILGLFVMTGVTYAVTGSFAEGGQIALLGAICGTTSFFAHERVWTRVKWGRL